MATRSSRRPGSDVISSSSVVYSSFDYDGLQEEFKGCDRLTALYGNGLPKLRLRRVQKSPNPGPCIGSSRPVDFPDDGIYAFCRTYGGHDATSPASMTDSASASAAPATAAAAATTATSTCLVQVLKKNHARDEKPRSSQLEVQLPHSVVDLAKITDDSQHVVACFESKLAVLKCTKSADGFLGSVESTVLFEDTESNDTAFHLVSCRPHHTAALIAASQDLHCIQLDGSAQKVWSASCRGLVTSIAWRNNNSSSESSSDTFSCTDNSGLFSLFDIRSPVQQPAASLHVLPRGLFAHAHVGANHVACSGLGGLVHILDARQLGRGALHKIADPFLQNITDISACGSARTFVACGSGGFTLWKLGRGDQSQFLEMQHAEDYMRSAMFHPQCTVTTDQRGTSHEWHVQHEAAIAKPHVDRRMGHGHASASQPNRRRTSTSSARAAAAAPPPMALTPGNVLSLPPWQATAPQNLSMSSSSVPVQEVQDWEMFDDLSSLEREDRMIESAISEAGTAAVASEESAAFSGMDMDSGAAVAAHAGGDLDKLIGYYFS